MTLAELAQPVSVHAFAASVSTAGPATIVTLRGEADILTLPEVVAALSRALAEGDGPVVVDLTYTEFIDARTACVLGRAWQFLDDRGRTLTLRGPGVAVRVLELLGLGHLIEPDQITAA